MTTKAWELFSLAHSKQTRKDGVTPYIVHPIRVMQAAKQIRLEERLQIIALGHDVFEDTDLSPKEVENVLGSEIVEGIWWLTNPGHNDVFETLPRETKKKLSLIKLAGAPKDIKLIKLLDRLDNLTCLEKSELHPNYINETFDLLNGPLKELNYNDKWIELKEICDAKANNSTQQQS